MHNSPEQLKTLKHVTLDPKRKADMRVKLSEYADMKPLPAATESATTAQWSWWLSPAPVLALLVLLFVGTGSFGVLAAAKGSLPGDQLYAVKTNVYEPLQRWLADTPAEIATVALQQSQERSREIAALESAGTLNDTIKRTLERRRDRALRQAERQTTILARTNPAAADTFERQIVALTPQTAAPEETKSTVVAVAPEPVIIADTRPEKEIGVAAGATSEPAPAVQTNQSDVVSGPLQPGISLDQVHERIRETLNDTLESLAAIQTRLQEIRLGQNDSVTKGSTSTQTVTGVTESTAKTVSPKRRSGGSSSNDADNDDGADADTPSTAGPSDEDTTPEEDTDVATSTDETTEPAPDGGTDANNADEPEPEPPSTTIDRPLPIATSTAQ